MCTSSQSLRHPWGESGWWQMGSPPHGEGTLPMFGVFTIVTRIPNVSCFIQNRKILKVLVVEYSKACYYVSLIWSFFFIRHLPCWPRPYTIYLRHTRCCVYKNKSQTRHNKFVNRTKIIYLFSFFSRLVNSGK